jgi:hypothetical protein
MLSESSLKLYQVASLTTALKVSEREIGSNLFLNDFGC